MMEKENAGSCTNSIMTRNLYVNRTSLTFNIPLEIIAMTTDPSFYAWAQLEAQRTKSQYRYSLSRYFNLISRRWKETEETPSRHREIVASATSAMPPWWSVSCPCQSHLTPMSFLPHALVIPMSCPSHIHVMTATLTREVGQFFLVSGMARFFSQ